MAQILVPDSDIATGSWTNTPLWSKVNDDSTVNPSGDGTTIASDNNTSPDNADLGLVSGTDPSSSTGHILRARWNKDGSGGHAVTAVLELWQGTPGTGTLIATLSALSGSTEAESTYTLSTAEADAITDYTDLNLRLSRQGDTGGNPSTRRSLVVDLVEFEVPDAGASPVNIALQPATATAAAQPLNLSLGAATTALASATASFIPQALGVSLGATSVALQPATGSFAAQPLGISVSALNIALQPATATWAAQVLGVDVAGGSVSIDLQPATAALAAQALGVTVDPLSIALQPATASLTAQVLGLSLGAATVALQPATAMFTVQSLGVSLGALTIALSPATATFVAQVLGVDVAGSGVEIALQPATASFVAQTLGVSTTALSIALQPVTATFTVQPLAIEGEESEAQRLDRIIKSSVIGGPPLRKGVATPLARNIRQMGPVVANRRRQALIYTRDNE